jgi:hypothetical protein
MHGPWAKNKKARAEAPAMKQTKRQNNPRNDEFSEGKACSQSQTHIQQQELQALKKDRPRWRERYEWRPTHDDETKRRDPAVAIRRENKQTKRKGQQQFANVDDERWIAQK